jgi:hypothetical protein
MSSGVEQKNLTNPSSPQLHGRRRNGQFTQTRRTADQPAAVLWITNATR